MSLAWWNGRIVPVAEVHISPGDAGFLFGDGLFETLRVDAGRARDLSAHLDRLYAGLRRLGIDPPESRCDLGRAVTDVAQAAPRPVARLRITVSRGDEDGPTRLITTAPYEPPGEDLYRRGVAAVLLPEFRIDSRDPLAGLKSLCYQANRLALRPAEARGAWDALRLNEHGGLCSGIAEQSRAGAAGRDLHASRERAGACPGPSAAAARNGSAPRKGATLDDLAAADGLLLMNSLIGALPVSRVDGREIAVGPQVLSSLRSALVGSSPPTTRLTSVPAANRVLVSAWLMMASVFEVHRRRIALGELRQGHRGRQRDHVHPLRLHVEGAAVGHRTEGGDRARGRRRSCSSSGTGCSRGAGKPCRHAPRRPRSPAGPPTASPGRRSSAPPPAGRRRGSSASSGRPECPAARRTSAPRSAPSSRRRGSPPPGRPDWG